MPRARIIKGREAAEIVQRTIETIRASLPSPVSAPDNIAVQIIANSVVRQAIDRGGLGPILDAPPEVRAEIVWRLEVILRDLSKRGAARPVIRALPSDGDAAGLRAVLRTIAR